MALQSLFIRGWKQLSAYLTSEERYVFSHHFDKKYFNQYT